MNALVSIAAWIIAGIKRMAGRSQPEPVALVIKVERERESVERDVALDLDHCPQPTRPSKKTPKTVALDKSDLRVLLGLRIDGNTAWRVRPPPTGWPIYPGLKAAIGRGTRVISLADPWGEIVDLELGTGASGAVELSTGYTVIELRKGRAEVRITSLAAEVEGVAAWYRREMVRAAWWLLGVDLSDAEDLVAELRRIGVEQHRIEVCIDAQGGIELTPALEHSFVTQRLKVLPVIPRAGYVEGIDIGERNVNPESFTIYRKLEQLAAKRGPERAAYMERLTAAGYDPDGPPLLRFEARAWGKALLLHELDLSDPGAALDSEKLARLWARATTNTWIADREKSKATELKDCPELAAWTALRAAGGHPEPLRLTRKVVKAQVQSTIDHARDRLRQSAADIDVLTGDGTGDRAFAELEDAVAARADWEANTAKSRARYAQLLRGLMSHAGHEERKA